MSGLAIRWWNRKFFSPTEHRLTAPPSGSPEKCTFSARIGPPPGAGPTSEEAEVMVAWGRSMGYQMFVSLVVCPLQE